MGFANLVADGISMGNFGQLNVTPKLLGMGDFLSSKAQIEYHIAERKRESWYAKINTNSNLKGMRQLA